MAQQQSRVRRRLDKGRSGLGARSATRPRMWSGASPRSAASSIPRSCTTTRWRRRWCTGSAERLDHADVSAELIRQAYADALEDEPQLGEAFRADIVAMFDRDPATHRFIEPVLYYKGFHAIQTHRLAHWLWNKGRKDFAYYLQSRSSAVFQCDIHPACQDRPRHLPRSCHRPRGRRDRDDRRRRVDPARRDARRHRQGARRPPSEDPPTA